MNGRFRVGWLLAVAMLLGMLTGGLLLPVANAAPVATDPVDSAAVDRFVEAQMDKHGIPGLALAVIEDVRVTHARGYGHAGAVQPMAADVPMPIGSVTRRLPPSRCSSSSSRAGSTSTHRSGPICRGSASPATTRPPRSLCGICCSTSGLSDLGYNRVLDPRTSLEDGVADLRHARLTARVGASFQYFNLNYSTLALIVETVSGRSYGDYVDAHVFGPLGMAHSPATTATRRWPGWRRATASCSGSPCPGTPRPTGTCSAPATWSRPRPTSRVSQSPWATRESTATPGSCRLAASSSCGPCRRPTSPRTAWDGSSRSTAASRSGSTTARTRHP